MDFEQPQSPKTKISDTTENSVTNSRAAELNVIGGRVKNNSAIGAIAQPQFKEEANPKEQNTVTDAQNTLKSGTDSLDNKKTSNTKQNVKNATDTKPTEPLKYADVAIDLNDIKNKSVSELLDLCSELKINAAAHAKKSDLLLNVLRYYSKNGATLNSTGILEVMHDGFGFIRYLTDNIDISADSVYVSPNQIRRFGLRTGQKIHGTMRCPKSNEKYCAMLKILKVNDLEPNDLRKVIPFRHLTPIFPNERLSLELGDGSNGDITGRIVDLIAPIGKGQRALIVSPPKAGKTQILKRIARAITTNNPECNLLVLLIDERPEEVTDMQRSVKGEVVASTFDQSPKRHVQVSDIVIEKAKVMVEQGKDVVILLDSITRLARAYNTVTPASGKVLTGGVDANALEKPKRFFGAARNIEDGGSLTIIATALVETGSRMDEVIYEEFKGTGNQELQLERHIAEKRVYPAININRSSTRRDDQLTTETELQQTWVLRKILNPMEDVAAIEFLRDKLQNTKTNQQFFAAMKNS